MKVLPAIAVGHREDEPGRSSVEETACRTASSTMTMATSASQQQQQQQQKQKALETSEKLPPPCVSAMLPAPTAMDPEPASGDNESKQLTMTVTRFMTLVGMVFLWTSAQIPAYFWGGIPPIVYGALDGADRWVWLITGNLLASAAVCPFVGALSDVLGRRYVALLGCGLIVAGQLVCTAAGSMNVFIAGMAVSGAGAGLNELTALAGTAEMAPTAQRGAYIAVLIASVLPFTPAVLWAQLLAARAGWRSVGVLTAVYAAAGLLVVAVFYHPPPRPTTASLTASLTAEPTAEPTPWRALLPRLDWLGGLLSTAGTVLLVAGLLWGGYPYGWAQAHVLAPLLLGLVLLAAFAAWEAWGLAALAPAATRPMVPARLFRHRDGRAGVPATRPRTLALALVVTFVSGANFFSVLMLWPSQAYNVYGHDPVGVGLRGLPFALGVLVGCVAALFVLTKRRGGNRPLLFAASAVMTAGCGALAAARTDNLVPAVYVVLAVAGIGVGGIVVPPSLVAAVVCPDDLIATATALTLAVRVAGGAVGYSLYYNVLVRQLVPRLEARLGAALLAGLSASTTATNASTASTASTASSAASGFAALLGPVIHLTATSQTEAIARLPGIDAALARSLVVAGQQAYADAYPYVYYASIGFGAVSMLASLFMDDIGPYMDDHVAVVIA